MPDNRGKQLWDTIQQDRSKILKLNEKGRKLYFQYGYDNNLFKPGELTDKAMSYIDIKKPTNSKIINSDEYKSLSPLQKIVKSIQGYVPDNNYLTEVEQTAKQKAIEEAQKPIRAFENGFLNASSLGTLNTNTKTQLGDKGIKDISSESHPFLTGAGEIAGYAIPFSGASKATAGIAKVATKNVGSKLAREMIKGGIAGAALDTTQGVLNYDKDKTVAENAKEIAYRVGEGAVLGAAGDLALAGLGKGLSAAGKQALDMLPKSIQDKLSNAIKGVFKPLTNEEKAAVDKLPQETKDQINKILYADPYGTIKDTPEPTLLLDAPKGIEAPKVNQRETPFTVFKGIETPANAVRTSGNINTQQSENNVLKRLINGSDEAAATAAIDTKSKILLNNPAKSTSVGNTIRKTYQTLVSQKYPLESIGRTGGEAAEKVAKLGTNINQTSGTVDYILGKELVDMKGNNVGKSMFDSLSGLNENQRQEFFDYMLNKHNVTRMAQNKPVFGENITADISTKKVVEYEAANPEFKDYANNVRSFIDTLVNEWGVKSGLIDESLAKQLREIYPDYVPTYRDTTKSLTGNKLKNVSAGKIIKGATGSESPILPLDQQIAAMTNRIVRAGRQNELYNSLYDAVTENPEALKSFARIVDKGGIADDLVQNIAEEGADGLAKSMDKALEKVGDVYQLKLYRQGKPVTMEISENMYKALKSFNELTDAEQFAEMVRKYATNPMKALITGYNPLFALKNLTRDLPTAFINSVDGIGWLKNLPAAAKEIMSNGQHWKDYQALGGVRAGLFNYDKGVKIPYQGSVDIKGMAKKGLDKVFAFNTFTEAWPRFAEYLATIEKMGNTYEAKIAGIYNAAEVSTNFARSGNTGKFLDSFVPYLNPAIQGIDKFARQLVYKPLSTIGKGVAVLTVPTIILDQLNKDDEGYKNLSAREKDNYYHISNGDGTFTRIPKSRENAVLFSTLAEWIARRSRGEKIEVKDMLSTIRTNFSPGDPVESFVLTPLLRFSEQVQNPKQEVRNFAGIPIVPANLRKYEPRYQYDNTTTAVAKFIGDKLNISPKALDYLIKSYGGVVGQVMQPNTSSKGNIIQTTFTADPAYQTDTLNKLYDIIDSVETKANTKNLVEKIPSKAVTSQEHELSYLRKVSGVISDLRKQQKKIESSDLPDAEKKKQTRELQLKMLELANKAINKHEGR